MPLPHQDLQHSFSRLRLLLSQKNCHRVFNDLNPYTIYFESMSTPSILLVTRPLVPPWDEASKNFAYFLAKSIRDSRFEFHLLTSGEPLKDLGENCILHPIFRSAAFDTEAKIRLAAFLAREKRRFDIVHFLFTPTPLNSFILKRLFGSHPRTLQTIATLREERWSAPQWKRMFFGRQLITYSDHSKEQLNTAGCGPVKRIYPGIDLDRFSPQLKDADTLRTLGLSRNDFIVSYVGEYARLGATDMISDMLIHHLRGKSPETDRFRFLFALRIKNNADREKQAEIGKKFEDAGIMGFIRWSGTVSNVAALYHAADIVTFPVSDLFGKFDVPLVIPEAYASGKAVILSDIPRFAEFSNPDICATIPRGNGNALWDAIEELRRNPERRCSLGRNARRFVEKHFDLGETARSYRDMYERLLRQYP